MARRPWARVWIVELSAVSGALFIWVSFLLGWIAQENEALTAFAGVVFTYACSLGIRAFLEEER